MHWPTLLVAEFRYANGDVNKDERRVENYIFLCFKKENLPRVLPKGIVAEVDISWPITPLFKWLFSSGSIFFLFFVFCFFFPPPPLENNWVK
jgi:hypothetical protein